jgi:hypothetical protein
MDPVAIYVGLLSIMLLASGIGSLLVRQTPGPDEDVRRWITRGNGAVMILSGLFGSLLTVLLACMPRW